MTFDEDMTIAVQRARAEAAEARALRAEEERDYFCDVSLPRVTQEGWDKGFERGLQSMSQLVREAIVAGFVRGWMAGGGIMRDPPRDEEMVRLALETAEDHSDLYPALNAYRKDQQLGRDRPDIGTTPPTEPREEAVSEAREAGLLGTDATH